VREPRWRERRSLVLSADDDALGPDRQADLDTLMTDMEAAQTEISTLRLIGDRLASSRNELKTPETDLGGRNR
jgi:hypothetical protein